MIFTSFIDNYYDIFHEITAISSRQTARSQAITQEHTAIVDAIKAKDKTAAREAICYHLMMVRKSLRQENNL